MSESDKPLLPSEVPLPPRTDLAIAAVFLLLGLSILLLSIQMPSYLGQKGTIYTAPGLVPGFYGIIIAGLSVWLGVRSLGRARQLHAQAPPVAVQQHAESNNLRLAVAVLLCVAFAAGLVGRIPFWAAAALFVMLFIAVFEWSLAEPVRQRLGKLVAAATIGLTTGILVTLVFEKVFLVRLP
jgi:hypothetical protein